jgi:ATP-dependent protease ClpP protease subunit
MEVQSDGQPEVYFSFSGEISASTTEKLITTLSECCNQGVERAYLMFSTPGGSVMHGMNLYNVMRALPLELTMHNVGNVDSIGNVVFLAGDKRFACAHSTFMFHGVGFDLEGKQRLEEKLLRERLETVQAEHKRIGAVIRDRSTLDDKAVQELFLQQQTKDAEFAARCGIVDEVCDVNIPSGAKIISLDSTRSFAEISANNFGAAKRLLR